MKYLGKKAVVTGGTHGMGLAVVRALLDGGAEVLLTGRDVSSSRGTLPGKAHLLSSDAASLADIDTLGTVAAETLGELDLVFVNVGFATLTPYETATPEVYDRTFDVNTKGAYFTAQRLAGLVRPGVRSCSRRRSRRGRGSPAWARTPRRRRRSGRSPGRTRPSWPRAGSG